MRQPKPRPWEAIGISRATWYRHGKPTEKPPRTNAARAARKLGFRSVRTMQRFHRVLALADRYHLLGMVKPALDEGVEIGTLERWLTNPAIRREIRKRLKEQSQSHPMNIKPSDYLPIHSVYWLHDKHHTDPATQGYVGLTDGITRRFRDHRKIKGQFETTILLSGKNRFECLEKEFDLRPRPGIGWNKNAGGGKLRWYFERMNRDGRSEDSA